MSILGKMIGRMSENDREAMMGSMMQNCTAMVLPKRDLVKRDRAAVAILSALVTTGTEGMSTAQGAAYRQTLVQALTAGAPNAAVHQGEP